MMSWEKNFAKSRARGAEAPKTSTAAPRLTPKEIKNRFPGVEALTETLRTHTYEQTAHVFGVKRHTVVNWVTKHGLKGVSLRTARNAPEDLASPRLEGEEGGLMLVWAKRKI